MEKKYQIIYADPPWPYNRKGKGCAGRHYNLMTIKEICDLRVKDIVSENALLFLWTTNSFLREAFDVVDAWGFEYKTCITWNKKRHGLGYWAWGQTEHCFLAIRGNPPRKVPPILSTIFEHKRSSHSEKPDAFRKLIEQFQLEPKLELFARGDTREKDLFGNNIHDGWDVWGNEIESNIEFSMLEEQEKNK